MHVLMVAAENDRLPKCKVGGVGDVIRDIPYALSDLDCRVSVIVPDYGQAALKREFVADIAVPFRQHLETAVLWKVEDSQGVTQYTISHTLFSDQGGDIYCNDEGRPFATDASRFAFFSAAVCEVIEHELIPSLDILHIHDWHTAVVAVLRQFSARFKRLKEVKTVFTVHNLALQGVRPFNGDDSSLEAWFPGLTYNGLLLCDPRYTHCFNPMRSAINLADKVHVVSPSYANEVIRASHPEFGFFGGEGLEQDMYQVQKKNKLVGILNGCEYDSSNSKTPKTKAYFQEKAERTLLTWIAKSELMRSTHFIASQRLAKLPDTFIDSPLVTSVGRLTEQKVLLLTERFDGKRVLDHIAEELEKVNGHLLVVGSGDKHLEQVFTETMAQYKNVLFLSGYGQEVGEWLYQHGDLFLMPSSFEPCGISQMIAMKYGQPCLVHSVGGLADTVEDAISGFSFNGSTLVEQSEALIHKFKESLSLLVNSPSQYGLIRKNATEKRFDWQSAASQYLINLYKN